MEKQREPSFLTTKEVAQALGLSVPSIWRFVTKGQIPAIRVGHKFLIPAAWLSRTVESVEHDETDRIHE